MALGDTPIPTGEPISTGILTGLRIADVLGLDLPGTSDFPIVGNIPGIGGLLGGLFGGGSDRNINLPGLSIPEILGQEGITIAGAGGGSFGSFRDAAVPLAQQIQSITPAINNIVQRFRDIGLNDEADAILAEQGRRFNPSPPDHAAAIRQNQSLVNLIASATQAFNKIETQRTEFIQSSDEFLANEEAKTSVITAQEKFAALQADEGATQGQKDEARGDLRLKTAKFLSSQLPLENLLKSFQPKKIPEISTESVTPALGILSNIPRQVQEQRSFLAPEPLVSTQLPTVKKDLPIRKFPFEPTGFPVRGKGLLSFV